MAQLRGIVFFGAVVLALVACRGGGGRIAECDALLGTVETVATCDKLDAAQRVQVDQAAKTIRDAIERLDDVGLERAPAELVSETRRTCGKQDEDLRRLYEKVAPECLR